MTNQQQPPQSAAQQQQQQVTPAQREQLNKPAEAGYSVNFALVDKYGIRRGCTFRAAYAHQWADLGPVIDAFIQDALADGWRVADVATPPIQQPAQQQAQPPAQPAQQQSAQSQAPLPEGVKQLGETGVRIVYKPGQATRQGNQVIVERGSLEIYASRGKFAIFRVSNWTVDALDEALALVNAAAERAGQQPIVPQVGAEQEIRVPCVILYKDGAPMKQGTGFYKDLVAIKLG